MFHELLENPTGREPGPLQANARQLFTSVLERSHLKPRLPGAPVPDEGEYVILGVASYSPDELQLLDEVEAVHHQWAASSKVAVFDLTTCKGMTDMKGYLPPLSVVAQSPVVALWDRGKLIASTTGLHMTRELLRNRGLLG
jgi:hypothetical protein